MGKRGCKVRKVRSLKCPFETYTPERKIEFKKEKSVPVLIRVFDKFLFLGGLISLFLSSLVVAIKGVFGIKKKIGGRGKVVRLKRKDL